MPITFPPELRQGPPQLELPKRLRGAIGHGNGKRERVQTPSETTLDVVEVSELGVELVHDWLERLPIEERNPGPRGKSRGNLDTRGSRLRPEIVQTAISKSYENRSLVLEGEPSAARSPDGAPSISGPD